MKFKLLTIMFMTVLVVGTFGVIPTVPMRAEPMTMLPEDLVPTGVPEDIMPAVQQAIAEDNPYLPEDYDIGLVLGDRESDFKVMYEPWRSKAAIHSIAFDEATGFLALGGGYLYDNEVHLFRLNVETNEFDKVWDTGDGIFQSDVIIYPMLGFTSGLRQRNQLVEQKFLLQTRPVIQKYTASILELMTTSTSSGVDINIVEEFMP